MTVIDEFSGRIRPPIEPIVESGCVPLPHRAAEYLKAMRSGILHEDMNNINHVLWKSREPMDAILFRDAVNVLVDRHQNLMSKVCKCCDSSLEIFDAFDSGLGPDLRILDVADESLEEVAYRLVWEKFDISNDILSRFFMIRGYGDECVFGFVLNHLISDANTTVILAKDFADVYSSIRRGLVPQKTRQRITYKDHIFSLRSWLSSSQGVEVQSRWRSEFRDIDAFSIPNGSGEAESEEFGEVQFNLPDDIFGGVSKFRGLYRHSLSALFIAAQISVISSYNDQRVAILKLVHHGRDYPSLASVLGFFIENVPIRIKFRRSSRFLGLLDEVAKATRNVARCTPVPFETTFESGGLDDCPVFNYIHLDSEKLGLSTLGAVFRAPRPEVKSKMESRGGSYLLTLYESSMSSYGYILYPRCRYGLSVIEGYLQDIFNFMRRAMQDPGESIDSILIRAGI